MRLVLDTNIFFSLMNPNSVNSYLFSSIAAEFIAPESILAELERHKEECMVKSELSEHEFEIRQREIESGITFVMFPQYKEFLKESLDALVDSYDAPFLATSLSTNAAIWSNDSHFSKQSSVKVFTTRVLVVMFLKGEI